MKIKARFNLRERLLRRSRGRSVHQYPVPSSRIFSRCLAQQEESFSIPSVKATNYNYQVHSLLSKRVLITRTRRQASDLAARLEALGAIPILIPTIEIVPPETYAPLDAALAELGTFDWLLFTSANAVEAFEQRRKYLSQSPDPGAQSPDSWTRVSARRESPFPKIAVIGPATARAVQGNDFQVDLIPPQYIAELLAEALIQYAPDSRILLVRAADARDALPSTLTAAGATVIIAEAYRNQMPPGSIPALQQLFSQPTTCPDAITFTSASTARNLFALLEAANLTLPPAVTLASIGPVTSQTLRDLGRPATIEAAEPTIPALIQSLANHFNR